MKQKNNEGFSLVEVLVAIVILAAIVIPACTSLVLSHRINVKADTLLRAQLEVSSAAETLMARGIPSNYANNIKNGDYGYVTVYVEENGERLEEKVDQFQDVVITVEPVEGKPYYDVTVTSTIDDEIYIKTSIRKVEEAEVPSGVQPNESQPEESEVGGS